MSDLLWMVGLALANEQAMLPIGILYGFAEGFYLKEWKPIAWLIVLLIASAGISELLKSIFKIPLICDPTRYGFPSGHTQFATVFYGWICYRLNLHASRHLKVTYVALTLTVLTCAVISIVHYGYHEWLDIIGGLASGGILLFSGTRLTLSKPKIS